MMKLLIQICVGINLTAAIVCFASGAILAGMLNLGIAAYNITILLHYYR